MVAARRELREEVEEEVERMLSKFCVYLTTLSGEQAGLVEECRTLIAVGCSMVAEAGPFRMAAEESESPHRLEGGEPHGGELERREKLPGAPPPARQ